MTNTAHLSPAQKAWITRRAQAGVASPSRTFDLVQKQLRETEQRIRDFDAMPLGPQRNAKAQSVDALADRAARLRAELATLKPSTSPAVTPPRRRPGHDMHLPEGVTLSRDFRYRTTPYSAAEIEEYSSLEIPAFLRRARP
jgi:hypothetical protein